MHPPLPRRRFRCESERPEGAARHVHRPGRFEGVHSLCASGTWHFDLAMHAVHTVTAPRVFLHRVRRLQGLPLAGEVFLCRVQRGASQSGDRLVFGAFALQCGRRVALI